jgi:hypothetical protein
MLVPTHQSALGNFDTAKFSLVPVEISFIPEKWRFRAALVGTPLAVSPLPIAGR